VKRSYLAPCLLLGASILGACHAQPTPRSSAGPAASHHEDQSADLPEVRVEPDGGPYLFSYYDKDGKLHDADTLAAIPKESRRQVLVRDLSRSPGALKTDQYLYLADVRSEPPSDGYPTSVVSRYQFEAAGDVAPDSAAGEDADGGESAQVIVYGTSWCGACKAARSHLSDHHIPFVEKDIEKEPAAAQELARKAKKAGLKLGGVPVIDVFGQLMMGYDPGTIDRAWASRGHT
jgi:glutaredoxin